MRVLVACEFSGIVREAFRKRGHDAWSCDLLPTEIDGNHYQENILDVINGKWDLMIAHPPCTFLTNAANRWLYEDCSTGSAENRHRERERAINFFLALKNAPISKIAIENPEPHPYVIEKVGYYHDKIQPHDFGEPEQKGICLWLKNLPPLISTVIEQKREQRIWKMGPSKDRQKERSRFFVGVAKAMADQWG